MVRIRSSKNTGPVEGFGKVLAYYKDRSGLTWEEIGARVGVKPTTLAGWLRYSTPPNRPAILPRLAKVLATPQEFLEKGVIEPDGESAQADLHTLAHIAAPSMDPSDALQYLQVLDSLTPERRAAAVDYLLYLAAQASTRAEARNHPRSPTPIDQKGNG